MTLRGAVANLLEKAARDNGFDRELGPDGDWLTFGSTRCPLVVWIRDHGPADYALALSQLAVAQALDTLPTAALALPTGATAAGIASSYTAVDHALRRAFQLSRSLPDEPLHDFERATEALPKTTEAERLVVQRVGQHIFRARLIDYWQGRCAITGLVVIDLLRASHVKPWARCESDAERLDVYNGLLLAPHLDAAFDQGFITIADDGSIVVSDALDVGARAALGIDRPLRVRDLTDCHRKYLPWHREHVFQRGGLR